MLFAQRSPRARRAFTLVELLTVIVIIGILAGLVTAAAIRVQGTVKKTAHALELKQLEMALHAYKERFGEFPPDGRPAGTFTDRQLFDRHVRKAFPRCTVTAMNSAWSTYGTNLEPENALTFWLGGIPVSGSFTGFSADPSDPFKVGGSRIDPFYNKFDYDRLSSDGKYYPTVEAQQSGDINQAIVYYRANSGNVNNEYDSYRPYAFRDARTSNASTIAWINPRTFQIISPGLRGGKLADWAAHPWYPYIPSIPQAAGDEYTAAQLDGMSNFMTGTLEDDMP